MAETIERAHEWVPPKRGEKSLPRCRVCGAVKANDRPSFACYSEPAQ